MDRAVLDTLPYYFNTHGSREFLKPQNIEKTLQKLDNLASDIYGEPTMIKRDPDLVTILSQVIQSTHPYDHSIKNLEDRLLQSEAEKYKQNSIWDQYYNDVVLTSTQRPRVKDNRDASHIETKTRDGKTYIWNSLNMEHTNFSECVKNDYAKLLAMKHL